MDAARNFAIQRFAKDLLESIDNFDRALLAVPKEKLSAPETEANKDLLDLVAGLDMTQHILMTTLQKHGLERFDPSEKVDGKTQKFDPNLHEATFMAKADGMEDGDVMHTQTKGFRLNGRVLRVSFIIFHSLERTIHLTFIILCRLPRSVSSRTSKLYNALSPSPLSFSLYHISYVMIMGLAAGCHWLRSPENCVSMKSACLDLYDTPLLHVTGGVWIVWGFPF